MALIGWTLVVHTARADDTRSVPRAAVSAPGRAGTAAARADAGASEREARRHYARGVAYNSQERYALALAEFEHAYALGQNPALLFTLGQVQYRLQRYARALISLTAYLERMAGGVPPERRTQVRRQLDALRAKTGYINLHLNVSGAKISVDGQVVATAPLSSPLLVEAGKHVLTATYAGYTTASFQLRVASRGQTDVSLKLSALPRDAKNEVLGTSAWIAGGGFGALAIACAIATAVDFANYSEARRTSPAGDPANARRALDAQRSRVHALALATDVLAGAALLSTGVALYVSWRSADVERATDAQQARPMGPATHGVSVRLKF